MPKSKDENKSTSQALKVDPVPAKVAPVTPPPVFGKTILNVSLQAWSIPTGGGNSMHLTPGASVVVPHDVISQRVLNLKSRRLITIS